MKITPLEIKNQEFKKVMRGYDPVEVNTFLDMLSNELEHLVREQKENRERLIELDTQLKDYKQLEKSLQQTLLQAQDNAERARTQAQKESELMIKQAQSKATDILQEARSELSKLTNEIERLKTIRETMINRLRLLLNAQLELLTSIDAEEQAGSTHPQPVSESKSIDVDEVVNQLDK